MKSRASSKCWQKLTNKDWRESFQELDRITALVPGKPEVVLFSFSFTSAIRFLRAYGGHIAMYPRACAVALSAISGHDYVRQSCWRRFHLFWPQIRSGFSVVLRIRRCTLLKFFLQLYRNSLCNVLQIFHCVYSSVG